MVTYTALSGYKPRILAIPHAIADHSANAGIPDLFAAAYMHRKDIAILPEERILCLRHGGAGARLAKLSLSASTGLAVPAALEEASLRRRGFNMKEVIP